MEDNKNNMGQESTPSQDKGSSLASEKQAGSPKSAKGKADQKKEKSSGIDAMKVILIVLVLGLMGGLGYLVMVQQEQTEVISTQEQTIEQEVAAKKAALKELEERVDELEELQEKYIALGEKNEELELEIEGLKADLEKSRQTASLVPGLRGRLNRLNGELATWKKKYEEMKADRDSLHTYSEQLEGDKRAMGDTLSSLKEVKTGLEEKVAIASVLRAEPAKINVFNARGKEVTKTPYKAKAIENIKFSFKLIDNPVAEKGNKFFALRVIEPDGSVLFDTGTGGGTFKSGDKEMFYTLSQEKMFDNTRQTITFVYKKGSSYKSGKHTVELFCDGEKIGEGNFRVR
ncbi:hypothetical protein RCC89_20350 [Cytophagaceae bacterium ABcell3]|nr:hypothetical protein RCC89_20350 [Cytophagaceae bacterium ABcell3]